MALNNLGLGFVFTARDLASAKMQRLETRFSSLDERVAGGTERMTTAFRQLGVGLAVFTAGAAAVAGAFALANAAGRFEQGLAAVGAVTRATTRQLQMLRDAAIEAGIQTQFSPEEAVAGLQSLATAGQTAEQATRTLVPVLDLAAGSLGQLGVAQAAEAVVGTLNAYGMSADQAASVTDRLLRITQLSNFQARDFEAGLAKAAAAGSVFGQELNDVLITMGLLRNRNIDASSSSTAFREAVRRVGAESRAQQAILGAGVDIFDQQSGRMRSIVDIMLDFADVTRGMSEEERNRRVATAFGARGLLAFNAILNASFTTMRDGREVTLQGAEAIEALRQEMGNAGGTAQSFREQLLDTFEGQKTLVQGLVQTLAVVLGEPFAAVFKPIVGALASLLSGLINAIQAVPAPIKKLFAGLAVGAGAFLTLVGGVIAAKAAIALLAIGFKALGITLGGVMATLLPAILVIAVLAAVVAGFYVAFQRNLGGIADFARRTWQRVSLFFQGLTQLFEQGGFSGAVREELDRAENQGLKRFLISVWQVAYRIQQIWEGFKDGFTRTIEEARPVFEDLAEAFSVLQEEIGGLFGEVAGGAASLPSAEFRSFGATVGGAIATVVTWFAKLWAISLRVTGGIVAGFRSMLEYIRPAFEVVGEAIGRLQEAWRRLTGATDEGSRRSGRRTHGRGGGVDQRLALARRVPRPSVRRHRHRHHARLRRARGGGHRRHRRDPRGQGRLRRGRHVDRRDGRGDLPLGHRHAAECHRRRGRVHRQLLPRRRAVLRRHLALVHGDLPVHRRRHHELPAARGGLLPRRRPGDPVRVRRHQGHGHPHPAGDPGRAAAREPRAPEPAAALHRGPHRGLVLGRGEHAGHRAPGRGGELGDAVGGRRHQPHERLRAARGQPPRLRQRPRPRAGPAAAVPDPGPGRRRDHRPRHPQRQPGQREPGLHARARVLGGPAMPLPSSELRPTPADAPARRSQADGLLPPHVNASERAACSYSVRVTACPPTRSAG